MLPKNTVSWTVLLLVYRLVMSQHSTANGNLSTNLLLNTLIEMLQGPLTHHHVFITSEESSAARFNFDALIQQNPGQIFIYQIKEMEKHLQSNCVHECMPKVEFQKQILLLMFVNSFPNYLPKIASNWDFETLMLVNLNNTVDKTLILETEVVQKFRNILLIEEQVSQKNLPVISLYGSTPFVKHNGTASVIKRLGTWDKELFKDREALFPDRFDDFEGEVLNIASDLDDFPLVTIINDRRCGMNLDIVDELSKWLNFSYTTTRQSGDSLWGELENGTWNGLLGEVDHGGKHFTINYFTITRDRLEYFDSSIAYFQEGFGFALKVPPPLPSWMNLIYPFSWKVIFILNLTLVF